MATVFPTLKYDDAHAAIEFLTTALGFEKHAVYEDDDGKVAHAELRHGDGMVMLGDRRGDGDRYETGRAVVYVVVEDPDALHERAKAAGAVVRAGAEQVRSRLPKSAPGRRTSARPPPRRLAPSLPYPAAVDVR